MKWVSYGVNIILLIVLSVHMGVLSYYKGTTTKLIGMVKEANTKLSVLETHYYELPEDFSMLQTSTSEEYKANLAVLNRKRGIIKNAVFIKYLSAAKLDESYVDLIAAAFYDASATFNMDSRELIATAWHESRFNPKAKSNVGATGVMQIMTLWLDNDNFVFANDMFCKQDLLDPVKNIQAGAYIYHHYKKYWKARGYKNERNVRRLALLSYNRGNGTVSRLLRRGVNPANGYFKVISRKFDKLKKLEEKMI